MQIYVSAFALGRRIGGDETHQSKLLSALAEIDQTNSYTLLTTRPSSVVDRLTQYPNFKAIRIRPSVSTYRLMWGEPWLAWRDHAEVLHAQVFAPFWLTCPLVLELPDVSFLTFPEHYPGAKRWRLRLFVPLAARRARRITTVSESSRKDIVSRLDVNPAQVIVIPNGVDHDLFHPDRERKVLAAFQERYKLPREFILFVGNLQPRKNLPRLIKAFHQLKSEGFPHKLVIVGAGQWSFRETFKTVEQCKLIGDVIFTGYVPESDLPLFYQTADVLVYPSLLEGFGLPVVEAMACGTPVVTSDSAALRETAGKAAILVNPFDTAAIAGGIRQVLANAALRVQLIDAGLAQASQFTWEQAARQTLQVYAEANRQSCALSSSVHPASPS